MRRRFAGVTASTASPCRDDLRALTSTNATLPSRNETMSISPKRVRCRVARMEYPRRRSSSQARIPQVFRVIGDRIDGGHRAITKQWRCHGRCRSIDLSICRSVDLSICLDGRGRGSASGADPSPGLGLGADFAAALAGRAAAGRAAPRPVSTFLSGLDDLRVLDVLGREPLDRRGLGLAGFDGALPAPFATTLSSLPRLPGLPGLPPFCDGLRRLEIALALHRRRVEHGRRNRQRLAEQLLGHPDHVAEVIRALP